VDATSYKTISANHQIVKKEWLMIDAEGQTLGRLTSIISKLVRGKHRAYFTPHFDCGDHVIVINAEKIKLTGNKTEEKVYKRYTGYPGGERFMSPAQALAKKPTFMVEKAVKGMLPKTKLGRQSFRNLHVIEGTNHGHEAQKPRLLNLNEIKL
jgi:large subunit ribosomal protein L13